MKNTLVKGILFILGLALLLVAIIRFADTPENQNLQMVEKCSQSEVCD